MEQISFHKISTLFNPLKLQWIVSSFPRQNPSKTSRTSTPWQTSSRNPSPRNFSPISSQWPKTHPVSKKVRFQITYGGLGVKQWLDQSSPQHFFEGGEVFNQVVVIWFQELVGHFLFETFWVGGNNAVLTVENVTGCVIEHGQVIFLDRATYFAVLNEFNFAQAFVI